MPDVIQLKGGFETLDPRCDRIPYLPEENRGYTVERLLTQERHLLPERSSRDWVPGPGLNQGMEGQCVLYGCTHRRNATPQPLQPMLLDQSVLSQDYHAVQHLDPWDGCSLGQWCGIAPSAEKYEGTSVHTAMVYGRSRGWWNSFWWVGAGSGDVRGDIVRANAEVGGIVYGLAWYDSMFQPRPSGLVEVDRSSQPVGGHCIYSPAVRLKMELPGEWRGTKEVVVIQQSWGEDNYGVADLGRPGGIVYLLLDDLEWLMYRPGGEGAVIVR